MLELEDLRAFTEVAESGGFGAAGQRLAVSKSMISRRVARLEAELGAQLFARTTRGVRLTEAGAALKVHAERILAELEAARETVAEHGDEVVGRLRVAAPLSFGVAHIAPLLAELALRHPRLEIDAAYSDARVDLIGEGFDVAIRLGVLDDSSLIARRVGPIHAVLIGSPAYLEARGEPAAPEDLADHDVVRRDDRVWPFSDGRREVSFRPRGRFRADSGEALLAAVEAGLGLALLPTFVAGPAIAAGRVRPVLTGWRTPEAGFYVVRPPPPGPAPAKVRVLMELVLERFAGEPYWDACYAAGQASGGP